MSPEPTGSVRLYPGVDTGLPRAQRVHTDRRSLNNRALVSNSLRSPTVHSSMHATHSFLVSNLRRQDAQFQSCSVCVQNTGLKGKLQATRHCTRSTIGTVIPAPTHVCDGILAPCWRWRIWRTSLSRKTGRDSSVGRATRYGVASTVIESQWGTRFSATVEIGPGAYPASYTMGTASPSR